MENIYFDVHIVAGDSSLSLQCYKYYWIGRKNKVLNYWSNSMRKSSPNLYETSLGYAIVGCHAMLTKQWEVPQNTVWHSVFGLPLHCKLEYSTSKWLSKVTCTIDPEKRILHESLYWDFIQTGVPVHFSVMIASRPETKMKTFGAWYRKRVFTRIKTDSWYSPVSALLCSSHNLQQQNGVCHVFYNLSCSVILP